MARVAGLDVPTIVTASLRIADAEGLDRLTMRRLSSELDVTPMAIYHHVAGKEQLLDLVVDESLADLPRIDPTGRPEREAVAVFAAMHDLLVAHPALAQAMAGRPLEGPRAATVAQGVLRVLGAAGLADEEAVELVFSLFSFTLGSSLYRISRLAAESWRGEGRLSEVAEDAPEVFRLRFQLTGVGMGDAHVREGLRRLVKSYFVNSAASTSD